MNRILSPTTDETTGLGDPLRLLTRDGVRLAHPLLDPWIADVDAGSLRDLYRDMVLARRVDLEGVALQRQGELALWAPAAGQEAVQVATAHACRADDFLFPSYRELGLLLVRGATARDTVLTWRGERLCAYDPHTLSIAPTQIIVGAQSLHAVGYGMGVQRDGGDQVAVAYFGDGATSEGDVHEAMVFAASFQAPVVFVCSNNQWAISEPVRVQSRAPLAARAHGHGIPSLRVDGNDALACTAAMRWALDHARRGRGPAFLEAVTYRIGPHTTSDDPTRYRDDADVEQWRQADPITRFDAYLRAQGIIDDAFAGAAQTSAEEFAAAMRREAHTAVTDEPASVFDHVYVEPHRGLAEQRTRFSAYLDTFEEEE
ncbi:pyruvate dehydrogenase (acetyl-transferring) E1 component subunit alpha [Microbacterium sp.]|uniref:pyruvate dehydrogenase (acetyl-transferring) E1 component subunit alpha n=1 Tax=Microbacterium sp. TaxID=51671 RepID=UPI003A8C5663